MSYAVEIHFFILPQRSQSNALKLCDLCGNFAPFAVHFSDAETPTA